MPPRHNLLARFIGLKHDPRTGGELTVTTRPAPTPLVKKPDPRSQQDTIHALCQTVHALQTRLAALEQGKFGMSGQPATLTVTGRPGHSHAPAPTRPHQPAAQPNVRPCPMVQAYGNDYSASANHSDHDRSVPPGSSVCPLVATGDW